MEKTGDCGETARIELIEGKWVELPSITTERASVVNRLSAILVRGVDRKAIVSVQNPVGLDSHSEPLVDIALLRYRDDFYRHSRPGPEDVLLLIEVSDSSSRYDLDVKLPLYARHGIREVWIVDLEHRRLESYRRPVEGSYREKHCPGREERIAPEGLGECGVNCFHYQRAISMGMYSCLLHAHTGVLEKRPQDRMVA